MYVYMPVKLLTRPLPPPTAPPNSLCDCCCSEHEAITIKVLAGFSKWLHFIRFLQYSYIPVVVCPSPSPSTHYKLHTHTHPHPPIPTSAYKHTTVGLQHLLIILYFLLLLLVLLILLLQLQHSSAV